MTSPRSAPGLRAFLRRPLRAAVVWTSAAAAFSFFVHLVADGGGEAFLANGVLPILATWAAIPVGVAVVALWSFQQVLRAYGEPRDEAAGFATSAALIAGGVTAALGLLLVFACTLAVSWRYPRPSLEDERRNVEHELARHRRDAAEKPARLSP